MTRPTKFELRSQLRELLRGRAAETRAVASAQLRERIQGAPEWRHAQVVLLFAPRVDEPDVWPLIREALTEGKLVALPSYDPISGVYGARQVQDLTEDLVSGRFGVREPTRGCPEVLLATLDLVLVPGLAFTTQGGRLGRGGGFYDRLLAATGAVRMGVGLDDQIVPWLPLEPHDATLDCIITSSASHRVRGG